MDEMRAAQRYRTSYSNMHEITSDETKLGKASERTDCYVLFTCHDSPLVKRIILRAMAC